MTTWRSAGILCWAMLMWGQGVYAAPKVLGVKNGSCNLFEPGQIVRLPLKVSEDAALKLRVVDYWGNEVWQGGVSAEKGQATAEIPSPGTGYYELTVSTEAGEALRRVSFGVAPFVHRSAAEVRDGGYAFGLKKWNFGKAAWGDYREEWEEGEVTDATTKLGLQWTRELFTQSTQLGVVEMVQHYPMNVVLKVERFPKEMYDEQRYGPMAEWEAKYGKGAWSLKTVPKKEPYQAWLKEQIAKIPAEQKVFEIWNEAWDKMPPEDFGMLCGWIMEVMKEVRPDAIVGPNLLGATSPYEFDAKVIRAKGMEGMKMVALHPYAASENREWLRGYRAWLKQQLGRDVDIYVTEFGSHSTPAGPAQRTEREQAQRVVRQALSLYAEGVKAMTPHWMGQTEQNPTYIEDWFGFYRINQEPKPVLMAYATAARMVDGSRYVGDLWFGPGMDAMVFEKGGTYTLAVFTRGEEKEVTVDAGAEVTVVDAVGKAVKASGPVKVKASGDVTYLVGIPEALAKTASKELRPERWPQPAKPPRPERKAVEVAKMPAFDGSLASWEGLGQLALLNPKVAGDDASGMEYVGWDHDFLYVAVQVRDNEMLNQQPRAKLYQGDSLELMLSVEPREKNPGYGPNDYQLFITPTSGEGKPVLGHVTDREAGIVADLQGGKLYTSKWAHGWMLQAAIPWTTFAGFSPKAGARIAMEVRLNDQDTSHQRFKIDASDAASNFKPEDPTSWGYLILEGKQ